MLVLPSSNMQQARSKKLMVSLCGLALSSVFLINNKAVVHADSVDGSQNNAITWDSDSDDSQVVQESQTKTEQAMPQEADDIQQNATQTAQNSAEMSTVRSVSATPRTTNQNTVVQSPRVANVQSSHDDDYDDNYDSSHDDDYDDNYDSSYDDDHDDNYDSSYDDDIDDAQKAVPVKIDSINGATDGKVNVHFVDANGNDIKDANGKVVNAGDYSIDITKEGTGQYEVPAGYQLNYPKGQYQVDYEGTNLQAGRNGSIAVAGQSGGAGSWETPVKLSDYFTPEEIVTIQKDMKNIMDKYSKYGQIKMHVPEEDLTLITQPFESDITLSLNDDDDNDFSYEGSRRYKKWLNKQGIYNIAYNHSKTGDVSVVFEVLLHELNKSYTTIIGRGGTLTDGTQDPDGAVVKVEVPVEGIDDTKLRKVWHEITDNPKSSAPWMDEINLADDPMFSFSDNSGNVKSVSGNTVNVVLTKPQSVKPDSNTFCHSQATRTIQINFPDGQIPKSYDGIVDKSGKLVQTVHFTRPATEDALTGNILWYGNWTSDNQDHNFIGFEARTLPRIPGYTLSIKPA